MKDETRKEYAEQIYQGKRSMQTLLPMAEKAGAVEGEWNPVWARLMEADQMLSWPTADSTQVSNLMRPALRSVNRLIKLFTGVSPEEREDTEAAQAIASVQSASPQALIISKIQESGQTLMAAYEIAVETNPMAESLELFKEIKGMAAKILLLPRDVAKLRGLS